MAFNTKSKQMFPTSGPTNNPSWGPWDSLEEANAFFTELGFSSADIYEGTPILVKQSTGLYKLFVRSASNEWIPPFASESTSGDGYEESNNEVSLFANFVNNTGTVFNSTVNSLDEYKVYWDIDNSRFIGISGGMYFNLWGNMEEWCSRNGGVPYSKHLYFCIDNETLYLAVDGELFQIGGNSETSDSQQSIASLLNLVNSANEKAMQAQEDAAAAKLAASTSNTFAKEVKNTLANYSASGDVASTTVTELASTKARTAAIETLLGISSSGSEATPDGGGSSSPSSWPKTDIESVVRWYASKSVSESGALIGSVGDAISFGSDWYSHWATNIPSGAKTAKINTYVKGGSSSWNCAIFTDENNVIISKVSGTTASSNGTFEQFTADVPSTAKKIYVAAYTTGTTISTAVNVVFVRDIAKGSSYNLDLSAQRVRSNYINSSTLKWTDGGTNEYCHQMHSEISAGAMYKVTAGTALTRIAFMTDYSSTVSDENSPAFCTGSTLETISAGESKVFTAPTGALYMYVYVGKKSTMGNTPASIEEIWDDVADIDNPLPSLPDTESSGSELVDKVNKNAARLDRAETAITTMSAKITNLESSSSSSSQSAQAEVLNACVSMYAKIGVVGTSWDSGLIYTNATEQWTEVYDRRDLSWSAILGRRNGVDVYNYAKRGATTKEYVDSLSGTSNELLKALLAGPVCDLYIIGLLGNDASKLGSTYLGTEADIKSDYTQNPDTFYGNYARIIELILEHAPNAKIVLIARNNGNDATRTSFANAVKAIATHYGLPQPMNWYDDAWYSSWGCTGYYGSHPSAVQLSGFAMCFERLYSKMVALPENKAYFWSYRGSIHTGYKNIGGKETYKYT